MIAVNANRSPWTPTEYLVWEAQQEFRHEYLDGEILAMTGGTINHSKIAANLITLLKIICAVMVAKS